MSEDNPNNIIAVTADKMPAAIANRAGALVLWRLSGTVQFMALQHLWLNSSLDPGDAPAAPSEDVAMSRAVKERTSGSCIASKLADGGWALVGKNRTADSKGADLRFATELRVWMNADDSLRFEPDDDPRCAQIQADYTASQRQLSQQDMSVWLAEQVRRLHATPLRDTGGVYFVPRHSLEEWTLIVRILRGCSEHKVFNIPAFENDADTVALILDGITQEAEQLLKSMQEDIVHGGYGERALHTRKAKLAEFESKLKGYESLLDVKLVDVRKHLVEVDDEVSTALVAIAAERDKA